MSPILINSIANPFNCWKFVKLTKLQRKNETSLGVNVAKAEKIS